MIKAENSRRVHQKYEAPHFGESWSKLFFCLKGLSYEIDFENVDENGQILALTRAAVGF